MYRGRGKWLWWCEGRSGAAFCGAHVLRRGMGGWQWAAEKVMGSGFGGEEWDGCLGGTGMAGSGMGIHAECPFLVGKIGMTGQCRSVCSGPVLWAWCVHSFLCRSGTFALFL